jgi:hypothetical protein
LHLFAKDLLQMSPGFLLALGDVTDWAGRTFRLSLLLNMHSGLKILSDRDGA